jgi:hypothetical protein
MRTEKRNYNLADITNENIPTMLNFPCDHTAYTLSTTEHSMGQHSNNSISFIFQLRYPSQKSTVSTNRRLNGRLEQVPALTGNKTTAIKSIGSNLHNFLPGTPTSMDYISCNHSLGQFVSSRHCNFSGLYIL